MNTRAQAGMAVVVAILLVALAASTAALMLSRQDLWTRQVENLGARAQADAAARAGIEAARRALARSVVSADPRGVREAVAGAVQKVGIANVMLDIAYADPQARFNINNLVRGDRASEPDVRAFRAVLAFANLSPDLAHAAVDALDGDSEVSLPGGAEDLDYLAMDPPRRAANRSMMDAAELARIKGYTPEAVARLMPFLTALPEPTAINVNSASAEALVALVSGLDLDAARRLVASREETPFTDLGAFRARLPDGATIAPVPAIGVTSRYAMVVSRARLGRVEVSYQALIGLQGAAQTGVIWRKQGDE